MLKNVLTFCLLVLAATGLFAQAANDDCAMAQAITLDEVVSFSTLDATTDGPTHADCFGGANDSIPADVWFTWTPETSGAYTWSNCNDADFDSRIAVYQVAAACDASEDNLVGCNDDGAGCDVNTSQISFFAEAGMPYVLRMGGYAGDTIPTTTGSGTVTLTAITNNPANDFCAGAIAVSPGTGQEFSTENALTDGPAHNDNSTGCFGFGSNTIGADIWYTFTPTESGTYKWSTCGMVNFDTRLGVYSSANCPPLEEDLLFCNDDGQGTDCPANQYHSKLFFDAEAGTTYTLRLGGFGTNAGSGTFDLINDTPPPVPANDLCANAIEAPLISYESVDDGDFSVNDGTTIGAGADLANYIFPQCLNNQAGGEFNDVWYSFQTYGNDSIQFSVLGAGQGNNPAIVFFMDFFYACGDQVDSTMLQTNCIVSTTDTPQPVGMLRGLPDENITMYLRVTSRVTSDPPGPFAFYLAGDIISDVRDLEVAKDMKFFPNPVQDRATVSFNLTEATSLQANVIDVMGRQVQSLNLGLMNSGANQFSLETSKLPTGVYTLQLTDGNGIQSHKFVVN